MNSSSISDRDRIPRVIKRKPCATIVEIVCALEMRRTSVARYINQFQREGLIEAMVVSPRHGTYGLRTGYQIAKQAKPAVPKNSIPAQWDALSFLFGRATVEP